MEWDSYDLKTPEGVLVEVKSSAYLQTWYQERESRPTFGVSKKQGWDYETDQYEEERKRRSDIYVFCLHAFRGDKEWLDPLDIGQWDFYVVATSQINNELGDQGTVGLSTVCSLSGASCSYGQLAEKVKEASDGDGNRQYSG